MVRIGALAVWRSGLGALVFQLGRLRVALRRGVCASWFYSADYGRDIFNWRAW